MASSDLIVFKTVSELCVFVHVYACCMLPGTDGGGG